MSSHPGSTLHEAIELALFLKKEKIRPQQVQDFYPTPGTISTCMFYTGLDPYTMQPVYVPRSAEEKKMQRALLQYYKPENRQIITEALKRAKRTDLIGDAPGCLIKGEAKTAKNTVKPTQKEKQSAFRRKGNQLHGKKKKQWQ